jgi:predicted dehydrogenase
MTFRRIPGSATDPLRVVVAGAGGMGRAWLDAIRTSPDVVVAGLADVDLARARQVADELAGLDVPVAADAVELARAVGAQALVDVTTPDAHHAVTTSALFAGFPVLGEKPAAASLAQALSLAAAAEVSGELFMVSQSRRWNPHVFALRDLAASLGTVAVATTQFFRSAHFPGFREQMADPLLVDMAIHPFDTARFVLASEPVSVYCEAFNPPWSWFAGSAAASAVFTFSSGARYVYTGSWCAPGVQTSWNGEWRISAREGSLTWDGESAPVLEGPSAASAPGSSAPPAAPGQGIVWALHEFVGALRTGAAPMGEVHENVMSLAMVEAAVASAAAGASVQLDDVLDAAHAEALRDERRADVRETLDSWSGVRDALTAAAPAAA